MGSQLVSQTTLTWKCEKKLLSNQIVEMESEGDVVATEDGTS